MRKKQISQIESLESRMMMSVAEPNNALANAVVVDAAGGFGGLRTFTDSVGSGDTVDFYRLNAPSNFNQDFAATLTGLSGNLTLTLIHDLNGNLVEDPGEVSVTSAQPGTTNESLTRGLITATGVYFIKVTGAAPSDSSSYTLTLNNDTAGKTPQTARPLFSDGADFVSDSLDNSDLSDVYRVSFNGASNSATFAMRLNAVTASNYHVDLFADTNRNNVLDQSEMLTTSRPVNGGQEISPITLDANKSYFLRVINSFPNGSQNYLMHTQMDFAGSTPSTAFFLGGPEGRLVRMRDQVGTANTTSFKDDDLYRFVVVNPGFSAVVQTTLASNLSPDSNSVTEQLYKDANKDGVLQDGELIAAASSTATNNAALLRAAAGPGTYYIRITGSSAPNYEMFLGLDRAAGITLNKPSFSNSLDIGTLGSRRFIADGLGAGDTSDTYKFKLPKKGSVTFDLRESFSQEPSPIDGTIAFDTNGNGQRDAGETIGTFDFKHPLTISLNTGTYFVTLAGGLHFAYEMNMTSDFVGNSPAKALNIGTLNGFSRTDDILTPGASGDVDYFKFNLASAQSLTANVMGFDSLATTTITLYKDNGGNSVTQIKQVTGAAGGNALLQTNLPAGNYQVALSVAGIAIDYSVGFSTGDNDDSIPEANFSRNNQIGETNFKDFSITDASDVDMVRFFAQPGDKLQIDLDSRGGSNFDTLLRLFDATGKQLASNDNGAAPGETASKFSFLTFTVPNGNADGVALYAGVSSAGNKNYNAISGNGDTGGSTKGQYRLTVKNLTHPGGQAASVPATPSVMSPSLFASGQGATGSTTLFGDNEIMFVFA